VRAWIGAIALTIAGLGIQPFVNDRDWAPILLLVALTAASLLIVTSPQVRRIGRRAVEARAVPLEIVFDPAVDFGGSNSLRVTRPGGGGAWSWSLGVRNNSARSLDGVRATLVEMRVVKRVGEAGPDGYQAEAQPPMRLRFWEDWDSFGRSNEGVTIHPADTQHWGLVFKPFFIDDPKINPVVYTVDAHALHIDHAAPPRRQQLLSDNWVWFLRVQVTGRDATKSEGSFIAWIPPVEGALLQCRLLDGADESTVRLAIQEINQVRPPDPVRVGVSPC
jgi:hypothetical protein